MKSKSDFTKSILNKISKNISKDNKIKSNNIDGNSYIMIPTNHKNIEEIIKLLNEEEFKKKKEINNDIKSEAKKEIITLNDIININKETIIISKNSIITPMAKDYIKQKKLRIKIGG